MRWTSAAARGASGGAVARAGTTRGGTAAAVTADPVVRSGSAYGRISSPRRLMLMRWRGVTLSEVILPPHEPGPNVMAGANPVVYPTAPIATFEFTTMRNAGFSAKKRSITY